MDAARGSYFKKIPSVYPRNAFYIYKDHTYEYQCQITEFTYWAIKSIRNQRAYEGRFEEIKNEWRLNKALMLKHKFPNLYSFLNEARFSLTIY